MAGMRIIMREYSKFLADFENAKENQLSYALKNETEAALTDFFRYAIKLTEHTWGGCGSSHMNVTRPDNIWTSQS